MSEANSESVDVGSDLGSDDAALEASMRDAEGAEGAEVEAEAQEKPAIDYERIAADKSGQAAKERARRKAAESKVTALEDRLSRLESGSKAKEPEGEDVLSLVNGLRDDEEDPITDIAMAKKILRALAMGQREDRERSAASSSERQQFQRLATAMDDAEADFTADHADYPQAVEHYRQARREEFEDMGYSGQGLEEAIMKDFTELASRLIGGGRDPAEAVYNLAKKRGFQSGQAAATTKLNEIRAAAKAGIGPTASRASSSALTYESVGKLKGAAFDAAFDKLRDQERRAN